MNERFSLKRLAGKLLSSSRSSNSSSSFCKIYLYFLLWPSIFCHQPFRIFLILFILIHHLSTLFLAFTYFSQIAAILGIKSWCFSQEFSKQKGFVVFLVSCSLLYMSGLWSELNLGIFLMLQKGKSVSQCFGIRTLSNFSRIGSDLLMLQVNLPPFRFRFSSLC